MVKVAVLGYGTVGSGIVEVIKTNQDMVNKKAGDEIDVKYILDLRDFPGDPYENLSQNQLIWRHLRLLTADRKDFSNIS